MLNQSRNSISQWLGLRQSLILMIPGMAKGQNLNGLSPFVILYITTEVQIFLIWFDMAWTGSAIEFGKFYQGWCPLFLQIYSNYPNYNITLVIGVAIKKLNNVHYSYILLYCAWVIFPWQRKVDFLATSLIHSILISLHVFQIEKEPRGEPFVQRGRWGRSYW